MSVLSWVKVALCLWLLRKAVKIAKWLLIVAVPLMASGGRIPAGTIRSVGHRWHPVFAVPFPACARHMVVVGVFHRSGVGLPGPVSNPGLEARRKRYQTRT